MLYIGGGGYSFLLILLSLAFYYAIFRLIQHIWPSEGFIYLKKKMGLDVMNPFYLAKEILRREFLVSALFAVLIPSFVALLRSRKTVARKIILLLIPLSVFAMSFTGNAPYRSLLVLPFALSFIVVCVALSFRGRCFSLLCAVILVPCAYNMERISMQNYSDAVRYRQDVALSYELYSRITESYAGLSTTPNPVQVLFYGAHKAPLHSGLNPLEGDVHGHSLFSWGAYPISGRGVAFMRCLGFNVVESRQEITEEYLELIKAMPCFPFAGSVKDIDGTVVVKFSD